MDTPLVKPLTCIAAGCQNPRSGTHGSACSEEHRREVSVLVAEFGSGVPGDSCADQIRDDDPENIARLCEHSRIKTRGWRRAR